MYETYLNRVQDPQGIGKMISHWVTVWMTGNCILLVSKSNLFCLWERTQPFIHKHTSSPIASKHPIFWDSHLCHRKLHFDTSSGEGKLLFAIMVYLDLLICVHLHASGLILILMWVFESSYSAAFCLLSLENKATTNVFLFLSYFLQATSSPQSLTGRLVSVSVFFLGHETWQWGLRHPVFAGPGCWHISCRQLLLRWIEWGRSDHWTLDHDSRFRKPLCLFVFIHQFPWSSSIILKPFLTVILTGHQLCEYATLWLEVYTGSTFLLF